jgi:signal transduction histidine kinase
MHRLSANGQRICTLRPAAIDAPSSRVGTEAVLDAAVSIGRIGAWHLDTDAYRLTWSPEMRRMMEVSPRKATLSIEESYRFYTPASRMIVQEAFDQTLADGTPYELELEAITARGRRLWVREVCRTTRRRGRISSLVGVTQDITERRQVAQLLADAADAERVRLGADLHDGLCQELTGLSMLLDSHARNGELTSTTAEGLLELASIARNAARSARSLAQGLLPIDLRQGGFGDALRRLGQRVAQPSSAVISVEISADVERQVDRRVGEQLFRITQEALSNAIRHGEARSIGVRIDIVRGRLLLTITDDGIGLPSTATTECPGLGLRTMEYRARILGGFVTTRTMAPCGTRVLCVVPLAS